MCVRGGGNACTGAHKGVEFGGYPQAPTVGVLPPFFVGLIN